MPVAARAADIDRPRRRRDRDHALAHGAGSGSDFRCRLAPPGHGDKETRDFLLRQLGIEQHIESGCGLLRVERLAGVGQAGHGRCLNHGKVPESRWDTRKSLWMCNRVVLGGAISRRLIPDSQDRR